MTRTALARLAGLLALLPLVHAEAASYRWVDEKGVTIYSQTPPPQGVQASEIKPPPPPPQPTEKEEAAPAASGDKGPSKEDSGKEEKKGGKGKEAKEGKKTEELRQKNCESAEKNLNTLTNTKFKTVRAPDGTTKTLDDETRETMRKEAETQVKEYCGKGK